MNFQKLFFYFIFIMTVFSQLEVNARVPEKKIDLDIVFIGNSITYGARLGNPRQEAPPVVASEYLRQQHGVGEVVFLNQGRSGYTTVDYLPSAGKTFAEVISATGKLHKPGHGLLIFSVSLGTNDSAMEGPNGSPVHPKTYNQNLQSIIDQLLTNFPDSKIVLQQPIWYSPNTYNSSKYLAEGLSRLQRYFPELESLVTHYSKSNPGHVIMGDRKGFSYFKKNYFTDLDPESGNQGIFYLHPNKKGAEVLGNFWGKAIYHRLLRN